MNSSRAAAPKTGRPRGLDGRLLDFASTAQMMGTRSGVTLYASVSKRAFTDSRRRREGCLAVLCLPLFFRQPTGQKFEVSPAPIIAINDHL